MTTARGRSTLWGMLLAGLVLVAGVAMWLRAPAPEVKDAARPEAIPDTVAPVKMGARMAEASVVGEVVDSEGRGMAARVCARLEKGPPVSLDERRRRQCVDAASDGTFTFEALRPAMWEFTAVADGWFVSERKTVVVRGAGEAPGSVVLRLARGVETRGRVIDISGGTVAGATVMAHGSMSAPTDDEGRFRIWTRPGTIYITAMAEGYVGNVTEATAPTKDLEIILAPGGSLSGQVVRAGDGSPLPGVEVRATLDRGSMLVIPAAGTGLGGRTVTDAEGRFAVDRLAAGRFAVDIDNIDWEGRVRGTVGVDLFGSVDGLVIEASPRSGTRFSGTLVVEGSDEAPNCGPQLSTPVPQAVSPWIRTEPDGRFEGRAMPGEYTVSSDFCGYELAPDSTTLVLDAQDREGLTWTLTRGASLSGVVVDESGVPVDGAGVLVRRRGSRGQVMSSQWTGPRPGGEFELARLAEGAYELTARLGESASESMRVELANGETRTGLELVLARRAALSGAVVDGDGRPVAGVMVTATATGGSAGAKTTANGGFLLQAVEPGNYAMSVATAEGGRLYAPGRTEDVLARVEMGDEDQDVTLVVEQSRGEIRGTVTDAQGPVSDAYVTATREGGHGPSSPPWNRRPAVTDVDGAFTLAGLPDGAYTVRAVRRTGGQAEASGVTVGTTVALDVKTPGVLAGRVVEADGDAVERFVLQLVAEARGTRRRETFVSRDGTFEVTGLEPGSWAVTAESQGKTAQATATVEAGVETTGLALRFEPEGAIAGRVVDLLTGEPVADAVVSAYGHATTDGDGRFLLEDVSPGPLTLMIQRRATDNDDEDLGHETVVRQAEVTSGDTTALGDIALLRRTTRDRENPGDFGFEVPAQIPPGQPVTLERVRAGGPAAQAGLTAGQVITHVHGRPLTAANVDLLRASTRVTEGGTLTLTPDGGEAITLVAGPPR